MLEEDVLWLEVTVDDVAPLQEVQRDGDGVSKTPRESRSEPGEVVLLDEVVEADGQELRHDARVVPEDEAVPDVNHVGGVGLIPRRYKGESKKKLANYCVKLKNHSLSSDWSR